MKNLLLTFLFLSAGVALSGQNPVWSTDVAPLLYDNCTSCHHPGGLAPFSLMTYEEAYDSRFDILGAVENRVMPPWPPDPHYSELAFPRYLGTAEIEKISDWVSGGGAAGNLAEAPTPPVYNGNGFITNPDLELTAPTYESQAVDQDIYRCFPMPSGITVDKFITQFECIPGNSEIVHHVLVFQTDDDAVYDLDAADPGPGYTGFGGIGVNAELIGAWVPGSQPTTMPATMGIRLKANSHIVLQVHYPQGSDGQEDATTVRMKLSNGPMREVYISPILNHGTSLTNGPLIIPPDQVKTFYSEYQTETYNFSLISIEPHMHLIGTSIKSWMDTPSGENVPLIDIPEWDFHWQGTYPFKKLIKVPPGSVIHGEAVYDNTHNNHHNPNDPPQWVFLGEATTDEMMLIYFAFTLYFPGDENIVIDPNEPPVILSTPVLPDRQNLPLTFITNPVGEMLRYAFQPEATIDADLQIFDAQGKRVRDVFMNKSCMAGEQSGSVQVNDLPAGWYFLRLSAERWYGVAKFLKE